MSPVSIEPETFLSLVEHCTSAHGSRSASNQQPFDHWVSAIDTQQQDVNYYQLYSPDFSLINNLQKSGIDLG